ncbi:MAG: RNB domain-containing ribonuclease, partial [Clostridia bacterium]|nr:RNB domain-containing ribonuclease [Clostridia bacterium]
DSKRIVSLEGANKYVCKYESKARGFGFGRAILEDKTKNIDIYVNKDNSINAFHGDIVLIEVYKEQDGKSLEGKVIKIIERSKETITGVFQKGNGFGFVIPMNQSIGDIYIPGKATFGIEDGDRVKAKITNYPTINRKAEGKIIEKIGAANEVGIDREMLLSSYSIRTNFSQDLLEEARFLSKEKIEENLNKREDKRNKKIYTIDSEDAKDLDDAIMVELTKDGNYLLSVHIADVSHYVREKSKIDKEAILRGTSIYTPGSVVPMLPKELSNGICSLNARRR